MRKKIIAGNWKMNTVKPEAFALLEQILAEYDAFGLSDRKLVVLAPPFPFLHMAVIQCANFPHVFTAAQNCSEHAAGAYTGEVSASMIASLGTEYVIIGHSERREYFKEGDDMLLGKVRQALAQGLTPIFCCGEPLPVREAGNYLDFIGGQLQATLMKLTPEELARIVIAYEPVWAIGTGQTATPEQAQEVHAYIRAVIRGAYGDQADTISILYGGSVNDQNAAELFAGPDVDGALVGGASLKAGAFVSIIKSMP